MLWKVTSAVLEGCIQHPSWVSCSSNNPRVSLQMDVRMVGGRQGCIRERPTDACVHGLTNRDYSTQSVQEQCTLTLILTHSHSEYQEISLYEQGIPVPNRDMTLNLITQQWYEQGYQSCTDDCVTKPTTIFLSGQTDVLRQSTHETDNAMNKPFRKHCSQSTGRLWDTVKHGHHFPLPSVSRLDEYNEIEYTVPVKSSLFVPFPTL